MRIGSIALVSGVLLYLRAISPGVLAVWLVGYVISELATMAWWRRVAPKLDSATQAQFGVFQSQLIGITAVLSASASAPLLLASPTTSAGVLALVLVSAGILMTCAAQHTLTRSMILCTAPAPAIVLVYCVTRLHTGTEA